MIKNFTDLPITVYRFTDFFFTDFTDLPFTEKFLIPILPIYRYRFFFKNFDNKLVANRATVN